MGLLRTLEWSMPINLQDILTGLNNRDPASHCRLTIRNTIAAIINGTPIRDARTKNTISHPVFIAALLGLDVPQSIQSARDTESKERRGNISCLNSLAALRETPA